MKISDAVKTIIDFLKTFVTSLVVIIAIIFIVIRVLNWHMFSIESSSMSPKYPVDSLIVVQNIEPENIEVGDVITYVFNDDGVLVTHRVVNIDRENQTFTTKGDANNVEDASAVLWGNMIGKVVLSVPFIGKQLRFITAKENKYIVVTIIVLLLGFSFIWDIIERQKNKNDKENRN